MLDSLITIAIREGLHNQIFSDKDSPVKELLKELEGKPAGAYVSAINNRIAKATSAENFFSLCLDLLRSYYKQKGKKAKLNIGEVKMYYLLYKKSSEIYRLIDRRGDIRDKQLVKDLIYFVGKSIENIYDAEDIESFDRYIKEYEASLEPLEVYDVGATLDKPTKEKALSSVTDFKLEIEKLKRDVKFMKIWFVILTGLTLIILFLNKDRLLDELAKIIKMLQDLLK